MTVVDVADMTVPDLAASRMRDIAVSFQPEGLWWDSATDALYIANDGGQQIVKYYEPNGAFTVFARLPDIASNAGSLGQLIKAKDGNWLTTRFGFSLAGAVLQTSADGQTSTAIGGLDVKRRRIGLTQAPDGTVFDSWFTQTGTNPPAMGTVSKVALDGSGETDVVTGIAKPVGVLVARRPALHQRPDGRRDLEDAVVTPGTTTTFATVPGADELAAGPSGIIFAASKNGRGLLGRHRRRHGDGDQERIQAAARRRLRRRPRAPVLLRARRGVARRRRRHADVAHHPNRLKYSMHSVRILAVILVVAGATMARAQEGPDLSARVDDLARQLGEAQAPHR